MQRIGVFVCHCGSNIAATVDVKKVVEMALQESGVFHAEDYPYMCSEAGQSRIAAAIREKGLTGIVVCSCSPRMHETTFRKAAEKAGINPYLVEIANIREHCSWIHKDMEEATRKAVILMRAAVAKVHLDAPLSAGESRVIKRALVIGGGIAGIQTALDIADAGYKVDIVEKSPSIGGRMSQLDKTFPTLDCSACILTPEMVEAAAHENITIHTYSEVEKVSGFVGNFTVDIRKKARYVDLNKCTGCGVCQEKCPSKKTLNELNRGLNTRTAIYTPLAQAIPNVPVIDTASCIKMKTGKCGMENMVNVYFFGKKYSVPGDLTIMTAMEYAGYTLTRGCGCRHGFCGACATIYRIKGKNELKTCLACQTQVQEGMYIASIPFFPTDKRTYDIDGLKVDQRVMMELYPEIYACVGCNACTKACTQNLNVMQYIAYAQRGEFEKCAEESFDCVGCGCCSVRCPAGISHPMVGLLARRLTGKYIAPKSAHLENRVEEINAGAYDELIEAIMQKPISEMQELYNHRDIEK